MNSAVIDTKGIGLLNNILASDYATPYLVTNDKTPGYDGNIQLSDGTGSRISNMCGRLDAQVKSHENKGGQIFSETKSFPIEKKYLQFYLNNNGDGLIYFHVYVGTNSDSNFIYYSVLSRGKLIKYYKECSDKESISIPFKQFPKNESAIQKILRGAYKTIANEKNIDLQETEKMESAVYKGFNVSSTFADSPYNMLKNINTGKAIAYTGDGHLISDFDSVQIGLITQDVSLKVGNDEFFSECTVVPKEKETVCCFCDGLKIHLSDNGKYTLNYSFVPDLKTEYKVLSFMVALIENRAFSIFEKSTGKTSSFSFSPVSQEESVETWKEELKLYSKIIKVLDFLGIKESVILSDLKKQDCIDATLLYEGLFENRAIKLQNEESAVLSIIKIGNIHLAFINIRDSEGLYSIHDIRSSDVTTRTVKTSEDHSWIQTVPIESVFKDLKIWECANFHFDKYFSQLNDIYPFEPGIVEFANTDLLNLLLRYDETGNTKILSYADTLSDWILSKSEKKNDNIYILNRLQTIKRIRLLSEVEKEELYCIVEDASNQKEKVAACALLERKEKLQKLLKQLSKEEVQEMKDWPIGRFLP